MSTANHAAKIIKVAGAIGHAYGGVSKNNISQEIGIGAR
jgi:hypothetical protein